MYDVDNFNTTRYVGRRSIYRIVNAGHPATRYGRSHAPLVVLQRLNGATRAWEDFGAPCTRERAILRLKRVDEEKAA